MNRNQPEGNIGTGDQPRMTETQLKNEQRGEGKISYSRQAQRTNFPRTSYGTRYMRKS
jgi:hypothetical protein